MKRRMTRRGKLVIMAFFAIMTIAVYNAVHKNKPSDSIPVQKNTAASDVTTIQTSTETTSNTEAVTETTMFPPIKLSGCTSAVAYCLENDELLFSQDADRSVVGYNDLAFHVLLSVCCMKENTKFIQYLSTNPCLQRIIKGKRQYQEGNYALEKTRR